MLREMPKRETNPSDPQNQPERRRQDRRRERQPEGWPSDERRKDQRRENIQMAQGIQTGGSEQVAQGGMTPDSLPRKKTNASSSREMPEDWQGENFQSGTSQAQKGDGRTPRQQSHPAERHEQREQKDAPEHRGEGAAGYSNPPSGKEFGPGGRERSFGPQSPRNERQTEKGNFGVSYDRGLGQNSGEQGAGGKVDSSQRDMGQTGQRE